MRQLVALLGIGWVAANLLLAYLLFTSGSDPKAAAGGLAAQVPLWSAGLLVGLFALILGWQCVRLALSKPGTS